MLLVVLFLVGIVQGDPRAQTIANTLQAKYYNTGNGLWNAPVGWWNSANALEALIEYMSYSKDQAHLSVIDNTFSHTTFPETENGYFDDAQWWGIAWVRAYQLTKDTKYLQRAVDIWNYVNTDGWDTSVCNGGVWWSKAKNYKNAIPNELFLVFCTLLHLETSNSTYLDKANSEWRWFEASGMINGQNLINDGLDSSCHNNHQTTWSYNQGVILGGLHYLAQITGNSTLIDVAESIATAASSTLVYSDQVLRDPCEPNCGNDGSQFKGVFLRYLGILTPSLNDANKAKYTTWINLNADAIWTKTKNPSDNTCGVVWNGPNNQDASGITQSSALDCFNAAMAIAVPE